MDTLAANDLSGVGGWLLFRVLQLLILAPVYAVTEFIKLPLTAWLIASTAITLIGVVCAIAILMERPVALAIAGLHLALLTADWLCIASWTYLHGGANKMETLFKAASSIAMCFVWFLYFRRSERVRNTFGRNL